MYRSGQRVVTQTIQKYLGSSYDVVKTVYDNLTLLLGLQNLADNADKVVDVADNLDDVTSVADNLTDVSAVADNIVAITEVNDKVDDFNTKYLGSYASAPTVDGNGDPLVEGATYWDTTLNAMFVYTGSQWVKPTGTGIVDVDTFTGDGSTASFPLDVSPASKTNTSVFIDGVYQEKDTYSVSTNLITFNTAPNDEASIEVIVNEITNFITGTQTETHTLTSGQTVVNLTNSPAFASFHIQGEDVDSQRLDLGTDYTLDLLTNTITLTNSYPENTVLKMLYGYDDDISVELAPLNQAILDHVNDTTDAHDISAIGGVADRLALSGNAVFTDTTQFATGTTKDGVLSDSTLLSLVGSTTKCRTEGFHAGTTVGNGDYKFLNAADSTAAGYVDGENRFRCKELDVYACEISAYNATSINTSDGRNVQERLDDLPDEVDVAGTAQTLINEHNHAVSAHPELSSFITSEADRAEAAADAAQLSAEVYSDTTAGLAATSEGDYFSVPSAEDDEYLILYLHDTGSVVTEIKRYPSANKVEGIEGDIHELGYFAELEANYVEVTTDADGNVVEAITSDGKRLVNELRVGNTDTGLRENLGTLELLSDVGVSLDPELYIDKILTLSGGFSDYSFILCDENGNISQGVAADGQTLTSSSDITNWDLKYVGATSLPDNSRQPNPSGGFTCTGITRINTGFWAVSNHGIASEGGSVQEPSIVFLYLDFTKIRKEINFDSWTNPVTGSIQGITFNPNDNTIWFVDKTNGLVRQTDYDATDYDNDIDPGYTVNGLAYNEAENGLWIPREGSTTCNLYSVDTKTIIRSINVRTNLDQMFHDPVTNLIYYTYGSNGTNGNIEVIDTNGNVLHNFTGIKFAQAIEGIYIDDNKLYITNDGGYHTSAKPPLSMVLEYDLTLGDH